MSTRLPIDTDPDLRPLAESFNKMADALLERLHREARFASDVSHELRSPLTTLSTSVEVLQADAPNLPDRSRTAILLIGADLLRFRRMVEDLLEISRMDSGSAELLLDEVQVDELVHNLIAVIAPGTPVNIDPAVALTRISVDKRRIERVVTNLLANASQHSAGVTSISAEPGKSDDVLIAVNDRGPQVPADQRQRIFERFYRGDASGNRSATVGAGLGLALVSEHMNLHGGSAWVEPGPDGGNRFVVSIPRIAPYGSAP